MPSRRKPCSIAWRTPRDHRSDSGWATRHRVGHPGQRRSWLTELFTWRLAGPTRSRRRAAPAERGSQRAEEWSDGSLTGGSQVHPRRHQLTRALGKIDETLEIDVISSRVAPIDCSAVTVWSNELSDEPVAMGQLAAPLRESSANWRGGANQRVGHDNIFGILLEFDEVRSHHRIKRTVEHETTPVSGGLEPTRTGSPAPPDVEVWLASRSPLCPAACLSCTGTLSTYT